MKIKLPLLVVICAASYSATTFASEQNKNIESATIFTLINIGVILLTTIFSLLIFNEKIKRQNFVGILLAIIAVFLVTK